MGITGRLILMVEVAIVLTGCAARQQVDANLPTYGRLDHAAALRVLAERAQSVRSVSAQAALTLTRADGQSVQLDGAVAMAPPGRVRLRAWKFNQAVFDLTLTPEGLWVLTPDDPGRLDFSFSGLKTAVLRVVRAREAERARGAERENGSAALQAGRESAALFSPQEIADLCASFQRTVVDTLLDRTFAAARANGAASVGIAGGVSANSRLRADALARGEREGLPVFIPSLALSTDNAAMIAAAGLRLYHAGVRAGWDLNAEASLAL